MGNWKLHTVEGTGDILPEACAVKYKVEAEIMETYRRFGYRTVEAPVLQFYDSFEDSRIAEETMFKFFDRDGRILVLRPDITTGVARIAATKLAAGPMPQRLCYNGKVFRSGRPQCEITQAGVELFGAEGVLAECEIVACGIEALLAGGLTEFQMELGQAEFFKGLCDQCGFSAQETEQLRALVDKKDTLAVEAFLDDKQVSKALRVILEQLPEYFGEPSVLAGIDRSALGSRAKNALKSLEETYRILSDYGFGQYISIDLSLVGDLEYYTGLVFKGFTHGVGFAICGGGRYDTLAGGFGTQVPAVGFTIDTDRYMQALSRQQIAVDTGGIDVLVVGSGNHTLDYNILSALRSQNLAVEFYLAADGLAGAKQLAQTRGIGGIAEIAPDGLVRMHDLATGEINETRLG